MELMQGFHDNGKQGQVKLGNVGSDLRVCVARVGIMAAQQGVNGTYGLFMKKENAVGAKEVVKWSVCVKI